MGVVPWLSAREDLCRGRTNPPTLLCKQNSQWSQKTRDCIFLLAEKQSEWGWCGFFFAASFYQLCSIECTLHSVPSVQASLLVNLFAVVGEKLAEKQSEWGWCGGFFLQPAFIRAVAFICEGWDHRLGCGENWQKKLAIPIYFKILAIPIYFPSFRSRPC